MASDSSRKVSQQFEQRLERAHRKFNKLRDIPFTAWNQQHSKSFSSAFRVFSEVWQYQQVHRSELVEAGLKRSEIGEIASKIGQLYYNFFLRTADTRFLAESYVFYEAIHTRQYFHEASASAPLSIKQLRYYARFIIVCLLLNKKEEAWNLVQEFQALITSYIMRFQPADAQDWQLVVHEITTFLNADVAMPTPRSPGTAIAFKPNLRCCSFGPECSVAPHTRRLREAVLVSYQHRQVKIAELPLDMFRMMQTVEWHDSRLGEAAASDGVLGTSEGSNTVSRCSDNPIKTLIYRTSTPALLSVLHSCLTNVPKEDIILLYLSVNSYRSRATVGASMAGAPGSSETPGVSGYHSGGSSKAPGSNASPEITPAPEQPASSGPGSNQAASASQVLEDTGPRSSGSQRAGSRSGTGSSERHSSSALIGAGPLPAELARALCLSPPKSPQLHETLLLPEDLLPLTRRQLFVIVDSDVSKELARLQGKELSYPALLLMSPLHRPSSFLDSSRTGSLFTMFLSVPVMAFCVIMGQLDPPLQDLLALQSAVENAMSSIGRALQEQLQQAGPGNPWSNAFGDALLRQHIIRFVLARTALAHHVTTASRPECQASCCPEMPDVVSPTSTICTNAILSIASVLKKQGMFQCQAGQLAGAGRSSTSSSTPGVAAVSTGISTISIEH